MQLATGTRRRVTASRKLSLLVGAITVLASAAAHATSNTSDPATNWRLDPGAAFNGVANAFDGTARMLFNVGGAGYACSATLLQGGMYALTAGHCTTGMDAGSGKLQFGLFGGVALQTRNVTSFVTAPGWVDFSTNADQGNDLAILKLSAPVTGLHTYALSTTNDIGKTQLITGYGTTNTGYSTGNSNWYDQNYGHFGYNTADVDSKTFNQQAEAYFPGWGYDPNYYVGTTYMSDFDNGTATNNALGKIAGVTGNAWTSGTGLGADEAIIAGGDSGGADFVWDGSQWVISAVHSWGWNNPCPYFGLSCDYATGNGTSYGDLTGSTAVFDHVNWINSVIAVPEPGTYALMLAGLAVVGGLARRRNV